MNFKTNARPPASGLPTEEKTVNLSMASGDQVITPTAGKTMSQVTVTKPATLIPLNVKKDIVIGGVTGIYEGEGGSPAVGHRVRFIDYDGTVLKTEYVETDGDATPPTPPMHEGLTFQEWNASYEDITADKDIWATYTTSDGKTHLHIRLTNVTGLQPTIYLYNDDANPIWLNLGDGSADIEIQVGTGINMYMPTYAQTGDYDITVWKNTGTYGLGGNTDSTSVIGGSVDAYKQTLTRVNIGANCTLKAYSFNGCRSMVSITIPNGITSIENMAFNNCSSLTAITIPDGVTSLGSYAFSNCRSLTTITIPSGVTSIGDYVLSSCHALTSIIIPDSVTSIGTSAFNNCNSLTTITLPSGMTSIVSYAFNNCYSLPSITIPSGVTSIASYAFNNCYSLTSITIPSGVTSIGGYAFQYCSGLTSITIPDGVTSIGGYAFRDCTALTSIIIPDSVTSIGNNAFSSCSALTSITIPDSAPSIGNSAFSSCYFLTSIVIPDSVTSIGNNAFNLCYSIVEYHILATTPPTLVAVNAFTGINAICKIYVPAASVDAYKAATNWATYANYIYGE